MVGCGRLNKKQHEVSIAAVLSKFYMPINLGPVYLSRFNLQQSVWDLGNVEPM
ncbi:hypothetical protein PAGA_a3303 [Pseudoalteromonas agarivorans DSM 14585]|uniref:Uncharacterized protein n=1 Tax=Pseudoalteromonas agarivorans DSM 14585 TaxID=1312369 RepID=A0ACA8DZG3_9GAMM|nr:hypothetical protein PAGA_a3303 [Pseudoalteromonas agarivorans DSM 14585]